MEERHRGLIERSQAHSSAPLKPVGSGRAFQNGNVNFPSCPTAFLRVTGKISKTVIKDYTQKMFRSIFRSVFLSLKI